jgi:hypothetical protein
MDLTSLISTIPGSVLFFNGCLGSIAAMLFLLTAFQWLRGLISLLWPSTPGVIISSYVDNRGGGGPDDGSAYSPVVVYQYEVNGKAYRNDRVFFGSKGVRTGFAVASQRIVMRYPVGKQVNVRYDPLFPRSSILESRGSLAMAVIALVLIGIAGCVTAYSVSGLPVPF